VSSLPNNARTAIRFDRHELAGAFGDIGLDLPLMILLVTVCRLDAITAFVLFGLCQVATGLFYRLPIPVQPLKAMAAIAVASGLGAQTLAGGGLAVAALMLALSLSGALGWVARVVPLAVVRGLQFGLGLKLALLALHDHLHAMGTTGYILGGSAFLLILLLRDNRKLPAALAVVAMGLAYVALARPEPAQPLTVHATPFALHLPSPADLLNGLLLLALPQIPLSVANAVLGTRQTARDLLGQDIPARTLGLTFSALNVLAALFGGVGVCHGAGGLAGHYAFGGRTGGSVIIYGLLFVVCGLLLGPQMLYVISVFPRPLLAVLLIFEGLTLAQLSRDMLGQADGFFVLLLVALAGAALPYGFCMGLVGGTLLHLALTWRARQAAHAPTQPPAGDAFAAPTAQPAPLDGAKLQTRTP